MIGTTPTRPAELLQNVRATVADALGLAVERVYLTPAPELLGRLPPAAETFAALVPRTLELAGPVQHPRIFPAALRFDVCVYSRVAIDRTFSGETLLLDATRGLFPLGEKLLSRLAGVILQDADGQPVLRVPLLAESAGAVRWLEGQNLVLAYLVQSYLASFDYALD